MPLPFSNVSAEEYCREQMIMAENSDDDADSVHEVPIVAVPSLDDSDSDVESQQSLEPDLDVEPQQSSDDLSDVESQKTASSSSTLALTSVRKR